MIQLYLLFVKTQLTDIIEKGKPLDVRKKHHLFIKELKQHQNKKILLYFLNSSCDKHKELRILSIVGMMMINDHSFVNVIGQTIKIDTSCTQWLTKNMINPFKQWIKACYQTSEYYVLMQEQNNYEIKFIERGSYLITILKRLIVILKNIPKMGRYMSLNKQNDVYQMFSEVILSLANHIYATLKTSFDKFLSDYKEQNESINQILKWFFHQIIIEINQSLTTVTTCKYYGFYQKGISASLIKQSEYLKKYKSALSFLQKTGQQQTKNKNKQLQKQFFPEDGSFNEQLYFQTLDSLEQSFYENNLTNRSLCFNKSQSQNSKCEISNIGYGNILQQYCQ